MFKRLTEDELEHALAQIEGTSLFLAANLEEAYAEIDRLEHKFDLAVKEQVESFKKQIAREEGEK
jgi:hypothetical protein